MIAPERASYSDCGAYRYTLYRVLVHPTLVGAEPNRVLFVMLNPSTATDDQDDPTIRRCQGFAAREGGTTLAVVNLFALRGPDPRILSQHGEPTGDPENMRAIVREAARADLIVAAWGAHALARRRGALVYDVLASMDVPVMCLGTTKAGAPRHPLYVHSTQRLEPYHP